MRQEDCATGRRWQAARKEASSGSKRRQLAASVVTLQSIAARVTSSERIRSIAALSVGQLVSNPSASLRRNHK